jgi:hypothetical protein
MVWEMVIGVILVMGTLTTIREKRLKKARKKKALSTDEKVGKSR